MSVSRLKYGIFTFFFLAKLSLLIAQNKEVTIQGHVVLQGGEPLADAYVYLKGTNLFSVTDKNGKYQLSVSAGTYTLICAQLGYKQQALTMEVSAGVTQDFVLEIDETTQLDAVEVEGTSMIAQVKKSPYNVVALDASTVYNTTMNLGNLLNQSSGVKMRQSGGVGSNMSISLNGFTGRRVRVFMDGVPMEGFGSAFQLNNIPVTMASRIEVYKGVVPVEFGADAIGGAINIVTNQQPNTYTDVSCSYGSFNTHKASFSIGTTSKKGISFLVNAFMNYSDNSYKVHLDKMLDVQTGTYVAGDYWVKRFHDRYRNQTVVTKVGVVKKKWADRFYLGLTVANEDADIQNASTLEIVYGARTRAAKSILPSLEYVKKDFLTKKLNLRLTANYNYSNNKSIDTVARLYNWYGNYMPTNTKGESGTNTLSDYNNSNFSTTANVAYEFNEFNRLVVNNVFSGYSRKLSSNVPLDQLQSATDTMRRAATKNVLGISYGRRFKEQWNVNLFGKHYYQYVEGPVDTAVTSNTSAYEQQARRYQTIGYGLAVTRFFKNDIQLKASAEKAYKLPSERELFGDEVLATGNTTLKAENSINFNLGASINKKIGNNHVLYADVNGYYRLNKDFIRQVQNARYGTIGNVNFGSVRNIGVDTEVRYYYKDKFTIGGTVTYMDLRNREKRRDAQSSINAATYNNRMPNIPYFYGNADATYYMRNVGGKGNMLSFNYMLNFVGEFYLLWESQGNSSTKATLPQQLYHDFTVNYSLKNGKYNIGFEALNFTDALLYDNFSLQKPGRSFSIKFRYYWNSAVR